jgi:hypothetical protein
MSSGALREAWNDTGDALGVAWVLHWECCTRRITWSCGEGSTRWAMLTEHHWETAARCVRAFLLKLLGLYLEKPGRKCWHC